MYALSEDQEGMRVLFEDWEECSGVEFTTRKIIIHFLGFVKLKKGENRSVQYLRKNRL